MSLKTSYCFPVILHFLQTTAKILSTRSKTQCYYTPRNRVWTSALSGKFEYFDFEVEVDAQPLQSQTSTSISKVDFENPKLYTQGRACLTNSVQNSYVENHCPRGLLTPSGTSTVLSLVELTNYWNTGVWLYHKYHNDSTGRREPSYSTKRFNRWCSLERLQHSESRVSTVCPLVSLSKARSCRAWTPNGQFNLLGFHTHRSLCYAISKQEYGPEANNQFQHHPNLDV